MAELSGVAALYEEDDGLPKTFWYKFTQQRLKAWQPVLVPRVVISVYLVGGVLFSALGISFLLISWGVVEKCTDYTDIPVDEERKVGTFDIQIDKDMEPPIWVYYGLDGFHQNHRRYITSRPDTQMEDSKRVELDAANLAECKPWVETDGRVNYPCGLIARSVFNDTYEMRVRRKGESTWQRVDVDSKASSIAWPSDLEGKFRNVDPEARAADGTQFQVQLNMWLNQRFSPVECRQKQIDDDHPWVPVTVRTRKEQLSQFSSTGDANQVDVVDCSGYKNPRDSSDPPSCNFVRLGENFSCDGDLYEKVYVDDWGIESGHFIVWMRIAGLPDFRKLWGRIDEPLKAGSEVRVHFVDNFPVKEHYGRKRFVISTSSILGGRNDVLGYGYLIIGCCCLLFGSAFLCRQMNSPRPLGDIALLVQNQ